MLFLKSDDNTTNAGQDSRYHALAVVNKAEFAVFETTIEPSLSEIKHNISNQELLFLS